MTGTIIPLRSDRCATSALDAFDVMAAHLLQEGRAVTLSGARLHTIRVDLSAKRLQLAAVIADLQARPPSGDGRIDVVNAALIAEGCKGLAHLDMFIRHADAYAGSVTLS